MTARPFRQTDSAIADLRAHACMLMSCAWLADWATDGTAVPSTRVGIDTFVTGLRNAAGMTTAQFQARGTTLDEAERAFESLTVDGYMPLLMRKMHGGLLRDDILPELRAGKAAVVAVNYGVIQDAGRGVGSFRGGHGIVVLNPDNGKLDVIDPLRNEVITLPIDLIEKAMERFGDHPWGFGRGEAGVVAQSMTWQEAYTAAKADLAASAKATAKVTAALAAQKAQAALATDERDQARRERDAATTRAARLLVDLDTATATIVAQGQRIAELEATTAPDCMTAQQRADAAEAIFAQVRAALGLVA